MELHDIVRELKEEKALLDEVIYSLEGLHSFDGGGSHRPYKAVGRRGRKTMSEEERKVVSERMRKYWEGRRKE